MEWICIEIMFIISEKFLCRPKWERFVKNSTEKLYDDIFALISQYFSVHILWCDHCACPHCDVDTETIYCAALIEVMRRSYRSEWSGHIAHIVCWCFTFKSTWTALMHSLLRAKVAALNTKMNWCLLSLIVAVLYPVYLCSNQAEFN